MAFIKCQYTNDYLLTDIEYWGEKEDLFYLDLYGLGQ